MDLLNDEFYETMSKLKNKKECEEFIHGLCANSEIKAIILRFTIAKYVKQGFGYKEIMEKTGASSTIISRVKRFVIDENWKW